MPIPILPFPMFDHRVKQLLTAVFDHCELLLTNEISNSDLISYNLNSTLFFTEIQKSEQLVIAALCWCNVCFH